MLQQIRSFFLGKMEPHDKQNPAARRSRIALATAALLLEMAHADSDFSQMEKQKILEILKTRFHLSPSDTLKLLELAEQEREESLDIWQFTNMINKYYDTSEKRELLEILWTIVYIDGKADMYEEYLMRKLNNLLNMDHHDMIEAKLLAKHNLNDNQSEE